MNFFVHGDFDAFAELVTCNSEAATRVIRVLRILRMVRIVRFVQTLRLQLI